MVRPLYAASGAVCLFLFACGSSRPPVIEFITVPEAGIGGAGRTEIIGGRVTGAKAGERVVLFAKAGTWWVQPFADKPFTTIKGDSTWESVTHLGTEYAAAVVAPGYQPPKTTDALPVAGRGVVAIATVVPKAAPGSPIPVSKKIQFSGYEWEITQIPSDSGGVSHRNLAENVSVDAKGRLHLQIAQKGAEWTCAEVAMLRSLGYGSYSFVVSEIPKLEPGVVLGMFVWDDVEAGQNHREMDVELSQWGDPDAKNAQFTIQPYYVAANVFRFNVPSGLLTHSFRWEPGQAFFKTAQSARTIAEHRFTSGIPAPGGEKVHLNLYTYGKSRTPLRNGVEVVIEKFEYLP
jgi:hypothetical protein